MTASNRLNTRNSAALVSIVMIGVLGGVARARDASDKLDHAANARLGRDALKSGDYKLATMRLDAAVRSITGEGPKDKKIKAGYLYELGNAYLEWLQKDKSLPRSEQMNCWTRCIRLMKEAATLDPEFADPGRVLCSMLWQASYAAARGRGKADWSQFIEAADNLLRLDKKDALAYFRRGFAYGHIARISGDTNAARKGLADLRKAIELDKNNEDFWSIWLRVLAWTGARDRDIDVDAGFEESFKAIPNSARLRVMYADHLRMRDRTDEVEKQLRLAVRLQPTSTKGHIALAKFLAAGKQYDKALASLQTAEKIEPVNIDIHLQRSRIHMVRKDRDKAIKALQSGIAAVRSRQAPAATSRPSPPETRLLSQRMDILNVALANAAMDSHRATKDRKKKTAFVKIARDCLAGLTNVPSGSPQREKILGRLAMADRDLRKAIKHLEQAYKIMGMSDLQVAGLLIIVYDSLGMPGKSEKLLMKLQHAPRLQDNMEVLLALARLKIRYKDYEDAEKYVHRALQADPGNKSALALEAELQVLSGKKTDIGQSAKFSREGLRTMFERIETEWIDGDRTQALAALADLRKTAPDNLILAERHINMHLSLGDKKSAAAILARMLKIHPDNENMKFQAELIDKTPQQRFEMRLARVDKQISDPFRRAWIKAQLAARAGKKDLYRKFLEQAAKINPDAPPVTNAMFQEAIRKKDWARAGEIAKRVETKNEFAGKTMQAKMHMAREQYAKAIQLFASLREKHPSSKLILRGLGDCYLGMKNYQRAEEIFGLLESIDPGDAGALIGLAIVAHRLGRLEENEKYVMRAYKKRAGRQHVYIRKRYLELREAKAADDEVADIIQARERLLKTTPDDLNNLERLARLCEFRTRDFKRAEELYRHGYHKTKRSLLWGVILAGFYNRTGQTAKGHVVLTGGVDRAENSKDKALWLVALGEYASIRGHKQAIRIYDQALATDPENPRALRCKAKSLAEIRNWPEAIKCLSEYLAKRPNDMRERRTLIQYRINAKQYAKAETDLKAILDKNPTDAQALVLRAALLIQRQTPAKAVVVANQAIAKHPSFAPARSIRARAYLAMGELEMARDDLIEARKISTDPKTAMELAYIYKRLGRNDDAIRILQSLISEHKSYEPAMLDLVKALVSTKAWPKAELMLSEAHKRFPGNAMFWLLEAHMHSSRGDKAKAQTATMRALALDSNNPTLVRAHLLTLLEAGSLDKALALAGRYKNKPTWSPWINAVCARVMIRKNLKTKADELSSLSLKNAQPTDLAFIFGQFRLAFGTQDTLGKMIAYSKQHPRIWGVGVLIGDLCDAAANDPKEKLTAAKRTEYLQLGIASYSAALTKAKRPVEIATLSKKRGKTHQDLGKLRQAERDYLNCLKLAPTDLAALNNLAYLYAEDLNEPNKALEHAEKAIKLMPRNANVLDTYGWVLARLKRYSDAKKHLRQSARQDPTLADCRYHLGWVYEQSQEKHKAIEQYRIGLELLRNQPQRRLYKQLQDAIKRLGD